MTFRLHFFLNSSYILGDLNVRLQDRSRQEHNIIGPHIFGKGPLAAKSGPTDNRTLFTNMLHGHDAVDVMTFKTPNLTQQVTYRDKNPPQDWSAYVTDPLILLQLYDKDSGYSHRRHVEFTRCLKDQILPCW